MIRTFHVVLVCLTWASIHLADNLIAAREAAAREEMARVLRETLEHAARPDKPSMEWPEERPVQHL